MLTIRRSGERASASLGWLSSRHTCSFADYYDPERMGCGPLRVINEDRLSFGQGFGLRRCRRAGVFDSGVVAGVTATSVGVLFEGCGVARDSHGFILTGSACANRAAHGLSAPLESSVPGVFAVGDLRSGSVKRVGAAIGEGVAVVALIHQYLAVAA